MATPDQIPIPIGKAEEPQEKWRHLLRSRDGLSFPGLDMRICFEIKMAQPYDEVRVVLMNNSPFALLSDQHSIAACSQAEEEEQAEGLSTTLETRIVKPCLFERLVAPPKH